MPKDGGPIWLQQYKSCHFGWKLHKVTLTRVIVRVHNHRMSPVLFQGYVSQLCTTSQTTRTSASLPLNLTNTKLM